MSDLIKIKRALVSVSDKAGVVEFARALAGMGVEIISTGGTARALQEGGVDVVGIETVTGFPEFSSEAAPLVNRDILACRRPNPGFGLWPS